MDCKDLMIGDWFKSVDYNSPFRITAIYDDVVQTQADYQSEIDGNWYSEVEIKDLVPIPLTEDILVKNGFDKDERSKYFHVYTLNIKGSYDFDICWSSVNGFNYEGDFMLTYVHQLQHLLRLCGIEKELTI